MCLVTHKVKYDENYTIREFIEIADDGTPLTIKRFNSNGAMTFVKNEAGDWIEYLYNEQGELVGYKDKNQEISHTPTSNDITIYL